MKRDYYDVLGVGRDADGATVKKAFRRLARELHPDVSAAADADEQFKEVVEAYEVLSSTERRQLYDRYGFEGLQSGGFVPTAFDLGSLSDLFSAFFGDDLFAAGGRGRRGADVGSEVTIELAEAARGVTRSIAFQVATTCETCQGDGLEPGTARISCPKCGGLGRLQHVSRTAFGEFVRTQTCHACGGMGSVIETPCPTCDGGGRTIAERAVDVAIPAGIHDGQRIRISGEGHAGAPGGVAGDAYVLVRVRPDARFVREGNDIFSAVDITLTQAALGATLTVPTLDGEHELDARARDTARRSARPARPGHAGALRGRPRRPPRARERAHSSPPHGRAAAAPRGAGSERERRDVRGRHGPARPPEGALPLRRIAVVVPRDRAEEARAAMLELFPEGFEEREDGAGVELAAYTDPAGEARARAAFGDITAVDVAEGWEDRWRDFHHGVTVGPLWVGPPWEQPPVGVLAVVIEPGRAFGTGAHPTTRLCLELLAELPPGSLLDVGCGSGVLAVAGAKLGFAPVQAVDHDPVAVETTIANAAANGVEVDARVDRCAVRRAA